MSAGANEKQPLSGIFTRAAGPSIASTWNPGERTVQVVMSTGAAVARRSWSDGPYIEELAISREAVDLSRADGMSFLDSHDPYSIGNRLGTMVAGSVRIEGSDLVGTVRISRNERGEDIARDLDDGHPFNVSVGYRIDSYEWTEADGDAPARLRATRWTPYELSIVAIPADPGSRTRNHERHTNMPNLDPNAAPQNDPAIAERERANSIRSLSARIPNADASLVERALSTGMSVADFRSAALDAIVARQDAAPSFPHSSSTESRGNAQETIAGLVEVLGGKSTRSGVAIARQFLGGNGIDVRSMGDRDVARTVMGAGSIWNGGQRAMHSTGDFAFLVGTAASNVLLERFQANPSALKRFSRRRNAPDFRDVKFFRPGEAPALLKVGEHGEIKSGTMAEESNGFRIDSYARIFALTFQAGINDGLGAFSDFLSTFAESAIQLEGDLFAAILDGNGPRLDDGKVLFHADHGNLATVGSAPTIASVNDGVIEMRTQRNLNNSGFAGTAPTAILVGPKLELIAKQLVAVIQATDANAVNPHRLEVVVEDRFGRDFDGWFLLADPSRRPAFLHGGLESEGEAPKVETREGWEVLGTEFRCVHHFGAGVHDYRAIYFNPGA